MKYQHFDHKARQIRFIILHQRPVPLRPAASTVIIAFHASNHMLPQMKKNADPEHISLTNLKFGPVVYLGGLLQASDIYTDHL